MSDEIWGGDREPVLLAVSNGTVKEVVPAKPAKDDGIHITFKKTQHDIEIDMDQFTWEDTLKMKKYREGLINGTITDEETEKVLNEIVQKVTGKDPLKLPTTVINKVVAAIFADGAEDAEGN